MEKATKNTTTKAINLFLQSIGQSYEDSDLKRDLLNYINNQFDKFDSCILWFKDLDNKNSALSKILHKYNIEPIYDKFSIIIRRASILYSRRLGDNPKKHFVDIN